MADCGTISARTNAVSAVVGLATLIKNLSDAQ